MRSHLMKIIASTVFILLATLAIQSYAKPYNFSPPAINISMAEQKAQHPITAIGQAVFRNGVKIPAYSISVPMGTDEDDSPHLPTENCSITKCFFNMDVDPKLAEQFTVYHIADTTEWILAPRSFTRIKAAIGANGNTAVLMTTADQKSNLSLYVVPACVGCALDAASIFFPEAAKENKKQFDQVYSGTNVPLKIVRPNKHTAYYQYQLAAQYVTDGVAKFNMEGDTAFQQLSMSLSPPQKPLARLMLNFFSLTHPN